MIDCLLYIVYFYDLLLQIVYDLLFIVYGILFIVDW